MLCAAHVSAQSLDESQIAVVPLLEKYVAALPSQGTSTSKVNDIKLQFPETVAREPVYKGQDPRSQTVMAFFADTKLEEFETHRLQAATLQHNAASQKILTRSGFTEIGVAPAYLHIAGSWRDHILFQCILY